MSNISHEEAKELHHLIAGPHGMGILPDQNDLARAIELIDKIVADTAPAPTYPEHEKLAVVATEVQAVLEFISEGLDRDREPIPDELVYAHWGVDYEKIIEERKQMLATYQTEAHQ